MVYRIFRIVVFALIPFIMGIEISSIASAAERPIPQVQTVDIDSLNFDNADFQKLFYRFDRAARKFAGTEFDERPYQLGGNYVRAYWLKGTDDIGQFALRGPRDSLKTIQQITVETIVAPFPKEKMVGLPPAKAAGLRVEKIEPTPDRWCVVFDYLEASRDQWATSSDWRIMFYRWDPDRYGKIKAFQPFHEKREFVSLPMTAYRVRVSLTMLPSAHSLKENFLRHARSADAMRDAYLSDISRMEEHVAKFIKTHQAEKQVRGEPRGDDPGGLYNVPLTPEEERAEVANAKHYFSTQKTLMREHYNELYDAWRNSFPIELCWPELRKE